MYWHRRDCCSEWVLSHIWIHISKIYSTCNGLRVQLYTLWISSKCIQPLAGLRKAFISHPDCYLDLSLKMVWIWTNILKYLIKSFTQMYSIWLRNSLHIHRYMYTCMTMCKACLYGNKKFLSSTTQMYYKFCTVVLISFVKTGQLPAKINIYVLHDPGQWLRPTFHLIRQKYMYM